MDYGIWRDTWEVQRTAAPSGSRPRRPFLYGKNSLAMSNISMQSILHIQKVTGLAGSENHLLTLLPGLREYGYDPIMLVLTAPPEDRADAFVEQMRSQGVQTDLMPMSADVDPLLVARLARYIRRHRFTIVHTHLFHADIYGTLAARLAGVPRIVSTKHGFNPWRRKRQYALLDRLAAGFQTHIITISQAIGQWLVQVERLPAEKMRVIYYALDTERFRRCSQTPAALSTFSRPIIGTVARLIPSKGVHILLDAFATCLEHSVQASLLVLGDGPERAALEAHARARGIAGHVHFLGYMAAPDVSAMIRAFDIFAFPTFGEGFGLVLLEAMAWGKPIVASRVMAIPEIVLHNDTGLLVPPGDAVSLAQALLRLMQDPTLCHTLGMAGQKRGEQEFTVERMVQQTVNVYNEMLGLTPGDTATARG
jgi:glycosyltransferase involved in cell wall biosynthesis